MIDKNILLKNLSDAEKETLSGVQQTIGKFELIVKLIQNINSGAYDYKEPETSDESIVNESDDHQEI